MKKVKGEREKEEGCQRLSFPRPPAAGRQAGIQEP